MAFGRRGKLFSSPVVERDGITPRYVDLPPGYAHLIIDSFTEHHLQGEERMGYNARVFGYKTAFPLVLSAIFEDGAPREAVAATRRLVDIRPDRFPTEAIYRALRRLPDVLTLPEARRLFEKACEVLGPAGVALKVSDFDQLVSTYFGDGPLPESLAIKGVALYGLAECWRSRLYADLLERGDLASAGRMVDCGHDGDRVSRRDAKDGKHVLYDHAVTSATLDDLLARLASADEKLRASAALQWQTGDYHASLVELDVLVDLCREAGAISASLTGAGLGGVVTTVIAEERVPALREALFRHFEAAEDAEVALVETASRDGRLPADSGAAVRALRDAKRHTRAAQTPFVPDPRQVQTLEACCRALRSGNDDLVRMLPADYYREGIARNVSVAGAGVLPTP
jgi:galactokinase